ncbi:uncharacterized protein N7446_010484 [Penicillium canescens]|uniref:DUF2786 domain-containing protein n=1 Tax=Penicillium canescens TaxID=5083 RepID=A0AAD6N8K6_PENCN|nr:uncharacterized protein N7446_010484 [Penicillium canescens]KAJ6041638.1 hypothetical protein N7460_007028 [Penicillium canescens]KAJ6050375.1 hypothetical protein N7446_010484 [Penicillium canescens]KAJ6064679.1 hypothetical protein N7444_000332 [Penicillium canescens]
MSTMTTKPSQAERKRSARKPLQKATVIETARELGSQAASTVDKRILDRIQKCLSRSYHANASEAEAKAALFVSQKLMRQHNVTQGDLMASDDNSSKAHYGGRSVVSITKTASSSERVMKEAFAMKVATTLSTLFDCKSFSTNYRTSVHWTFFGIADNTVAAAMGFEFAHNQNLERLDLVAAKEREESKKRQREVDRLRLLPTCKTDLNSHSDSEDKGLMPKTPVLNMAASGIDSSIDSDSDFDEVDGLDNKADFSIDDAQIIDIGHDLDKSMKIFVKHESPEPSKPIEIPKYSSESETTIKPEFSPTFTPVTSPWGSGMQLVQFRATAEQVADDYLKQNNIKLRSGRKRSSIV